MTLQPWIFHNPVKVHFGAGCRTALAARLAGQKLLVVTTARGRAQFTADPALGKIKADLTWVDNVTPNPGLAETQVEIDRLAGQSFDAVLAFGGGSAIDAAKALAAGLTPGLSCRDLARLIAEPAVHLDHPLLPIHAITTTSGTGAEVTPFATIWDHENRKKLSLASSRLFPVTAVVDPELTYGLPDAATLSTSLDALNQAFESVWNHNRSPLTTIMAARAIGLALEGIPRLHASLEDHEARELIAEASLLAGLCISQTRTAICHSVSYPLTAHFGIAHGLACALSMSAVAHQVLAEAPDGLAEVAVLNGLKDAKALVAQLDSVLDGVGLYNLVKQELPDAAAIRALYEEMYTPGRSDNFILSIDNHRLDRIFDRVNAQYNLATSEQAISLIDIEQWQSRYDELLATSSKDEATRAYQQQQFSLLDRELADVPLEDTPQLLTRRASLARRLRKFEQAIEIWRIHGQLNPKDATTATLNIADIHLLKNEVPEAQALIETIAEHDGLLYRRIRGKMSDMQRLLDSSQAFQNALQHFDNGDSTKFRETLLQALSLLHSDAISQHPLVIALVEDMSKACGQSGAVEFPEIALPVIHSNAEPVAIFAAGFGWSGSGAVFDFLRNHNDADAFSIHELLLLSSNADEGDVLKCLNAAQQAPVVFRRMLVATICHGVLGLSECGGRGVSFVTKASELSLLQSFCAHSSAQDTMLLLTRRLISDSLRSSKSSQQAETGFVEAFSEFFQNILRLKMRDRRFLLFSNAVSGLDIKAMKLLPDTSRAVATVRDVRDAYADRFNAGKHWDASVFVRSYRGKRRKYEAGLADPDVRKKVIQISFEDLIQSPESRMALLCKLGMDPAGWNADGQYFDPEKSARNIGIYPRFADQEAIAHVAAELSEYLYSA